MQKLFFLLGALLFHSVSHAAIVFTDDFTTGASPLWGNESGGWFSSGGAYDAQFPNNAPITYSSLPFDLQDFSIELDITNVQDGGIWLRSLDNQNGILLVTGAGVGGLYWHIISGGNVSPSLNVVGGLFTNGISDPHLRVTVEGDTYSVYVNGSPTPATTLTDSTFSSGRVALYDFSPQTFDNVAVSVPEPSAALFALGGVSALLRRRRAKLP